MMMKRTLNAIPALALALTAVLTLSGCSKRADDAAVTPGSSSSTTSPSGTSGSGSGAMPPASGVSGARN